MGLRLSPGWGGALLWAFCGLTTPRVSGQASRPLFDDSVMQEIRLDLAPTDWQTLRRNYWLDTFYPANFRWNGQSVSNIGIRSRGQGSRSPDKPNLKLEFNHYLKGQEFLGLQSLVLKANNQDPSLLREILTMKLYQRVGLPAPREAPARLYINGEFWGAYSIVEQVDEAFLRHNFGEDAGYLYSWQPNHDSGYHFEYLGADPTLYSPVMWTPETHKTDPDPGPIVAMVQSVNSSPDAEFQTEVSQFLDLKQTMTFLAVQDYAAPYDAFLGLVFGMNNFYFYRFAGSTVGQFLPWDQDSAFDWEHTPLFQGVSANVMARRAMLVPELRQIYLDGVMKAATVSGGQGGWLEQELDRLYALIRDSAIQDPHKQCSPGGVIGPCGAADFEADVAHLHVFLGERLPFETTAVTGAGYLPSATLPAIQYIGVAGVSPDGSPSANPGSLVTISGQYLATDAVQAPPNTEPTSLDGVIVAVNGARASLLSVSPGQVTARIPPDTAIGTAAIAVIVNGAVGNTMTVAISGTGN